MFVRPLAIQGCAKLADLGCQAFGAASAISLLGGLYLADARDTLAARYARMTILDPNGHGPETQRRARALFGCFDGVFRF